MHGENERKLARLLKVLYILREMGWGGGGQGVSALSSMRHGCEFKAELPALKLIHCKQDPGVACLISPRSNVLLVGLLEEFVLWQIPTPNDLIGISWMNKRELGYPEAFAIL